MLGEKKEKVKKKENEEGLTPKHIQEVVDQIGCSRNQAIRTLRATQDNVAAAISKLTKWVAGGKRPAKEVISSPGELDFE